MGKHLQYKDRYHIEIELKKKTPVSQIAKDLGVTRQTIYNEIKRGTFTQRRSVDWKEIQVYGSDVGQNLRDKNAHNKGAKKKLRPDDEWLMQVMELVTKKHYSPWCARFVIGGKKVCTSTIYNYVHSGYLPNITANNLPYAKPHKKEQEQRQKREFSRGTSIEQRPQEIMERKTYGHWEMDTVYSSKDDLHCLLVLSERKTRQEKIFRIKDRTVKSVIRALNRYERQIGTPAFRKIFKTITCDNGMEFADWQSIENSCRTKGKRTTVYFCHPYCSQERGTNENINRMIRRWIPKGDDIGLYTPKEIKEIENWINNYPRPQFGGLSANEVVVTRG